MQIRSLISHTVSWLHEVAGSGHLLFSISALASLFGIEADNRLIVNTQELVTAVDDAGSYGAELSDSLTACGMLTGIVVFGYTLAEVSLNAGLFGTCVSSRCRSLSH